MVEGYSTVAPTLNSRLAAACNCAYGISASDGEYSKSPPYDGAVGWRATPAVIAARESGQSRGPYINACLVGLNGDGIVVAFRGTLPPAWTVASVEDWWQDIVDSSPVSAPPLPGEVHGGFWAALETLWLRVLKSVRQLQAAHPGTPIYVTGHSKGGPLATLGAARLLLEAEVQAAQVITFASPMPGNAVFVANYPSQLQPVIRFENYLDIVPFLPPSDTFFQFFQEAIPASVQTEFCAWFPNLCTALKNASVWDYSALGTLQFVTEMGQVVGAKDFQADYEFRLIQIILELFGAPSADSEVVTLENLVATESQEARLTRIGDAHCIACKAQYCAGGYMTGAGGDPICPAP